MANLSRQWKVAELLRRSSDTASRRSPLDDGRQMDGSIHTATVIGVDCVEPPADPNEWNDEQWLEWLKATDDAPFDDSEESISEVVMRIVRSTPGLVIGQAMLGMAQAIYGRQNDEVVVVVEDNGETTDDKPFAVRLDFDHPERSLVSSSRLKLPDLRTESLEVDVIGSAALYEKAIFCIGSGPKMYVRCTNKFAVDRSGESDVPTIH